MTYEQLEAIAKDLSYINTLLYEYHQQLTSKELADFADLRNIITPLFDHHILVIDEELRELDHLWNKFDELT